MRQTNGFTLIELIIVVAIGAILITLAMPSMRDTIQNNRTTAHANALAGALALARSEAVRRGTSTSVCAEGGNWQDGWSVQINATCEATATPDAGVLNVYTDIDGMVASATAARIEYGSDGFKRTPTAAVVITLRPSGCPSGAADKARTLTINATGRASMTRTACT